MDIHIQLPENSKLLLKKGTAVAIGDKFYSLSSQKDLAVPISSPLKINPGRIFQHLDVTVGQEVEKGTLLASKKTFLGRKSVTSENKGTITKVDHETGEVTISGGQSTSGVVTAFFNGEIVDYDKQKYLVTIAINKGDAFELKEVSENGGGKIVHIDITANYFSLTEEDLKGKIILIDELQNHMTAKLEALGAMGILTLKGAAQTDLPVGKVKLIDDFKKLATGNYTYVIFSSSEKKAIAYN